MPGIPPRMHLRGPRKAIKAAECPIPPVLAKPSEIPLSFCLFSVDLAWESGS